MVSKSGITGEGLGLEFGVGQGVAPNGRGASAHELERLRAVQPCDDVLEYTMRCVLALAPQLEAEVLAPWQTVCDDLAALRVPAQRRALRLRIEDMRWQWSDADTLTLSFTLTAGAFATSMLQCLAYLDEEQSHALSAEQ